MNIFVLDRDPRTAARHHCDKHVVKMVVETGQILSTAHFILGNGDCPVSCYKPYNPRHPSVIWTAETLGNYRWTRRLFAALSDEFAFRYGKDHATWNRLRELPEPTSLADRKVTDFAVCVPDSCVVVNDPVKSYRLYYLRHKKPFARWTRRRPPRWWAN